MKGIRGSRTWVGRLSVLLIILLGASAIGEVFAGTSAEGHENSAPEYPVEASASEPTADPPHPNHGGAKPKPYIRPLAPARRYRPHGPADSFHPAPGEKVFRIAIPDIGVDEVVVQGADQTSLARNPGHYPSCGRGFPPPYCSDFEEVWPGERGRVVIGGHRTLATRPFFRLGELQRGDEVLIDTRWGDFGYLITDRRIVAPDDRSIIVPGVAQRQLVLVTCHPKFSAAQRLIIFAELDRWGPPRQGSLYRLDETSHE